MVLNNILNITEKNKEKELLFNLGFYLAVLFNALLWLLLFYNFKPTSEQIGLHYNIYFGIDYYGFWYKIYLIPATGALIIAVNFILAKIIFKKEKLLAYALNYSAAFLQIMLAIAAVSIIINI